jgi:hypothetical protein
VTEIARLTVAMTELPQNTNVNQLRPRAYQLEMLEASLKENIIVAVSEPKDSKTMKSDAIADGHWKREDPNVNSASALKLSRTDCML